MKTENNKQWIAYFSDYVSASNFFCEIEDMGISARIISNNRVRFYAESITPEIVKLLPSKDKLDIRKV